MGLILIETLEQKLRSDQHPENPMDVLEHWLADAREDSHVPNPNAMTVASLADGKPSARIVLCKGLDTGLGYLVFYTNYQSRKGGELVDGAPAACVFHWDQSGRQVRIEGVAQRSPAAESDAYFNSRYWRSQLGAWASEQSQSIESRAALDEQLRRFAQRFGVDPHGSSPPSTPIPRPPHWGGIRIWAQTMELWLDGSARLHDRFRYSRELTAAPDGAFYASDWQAVRLQP